MSVRTDVRVAPRPRLGLTVAIVGHRPERLQDTGAVQGRIGDILDLIQAGLTATPAELGYDAERPRLRLVSALAEGADQLAAAAATQAGLAFDAILPFPAEEYERDFVTAGSRATFRALLQQAGSVLVLDGAGEGVARNRAYDAAGKALLDNCDLLIAVWDGKPGRGRGGTHDVVEEAVRRALPVVTISPDGRSALLRHRPFDAVVGALRLEDLPAGPLEGLSDLVGRLMGQEARDPIDPPWPELLQTPSRPVLYRAYPLLLGAIGLGRRRAAKAKPALIPEAPPANRLEDAFSWWDASAITAAQAFRSAVIVNFALAALAVVLAALSLFSGDGKWIFVLAEVATILLLLGNTWRAGRSRWQERWLESREIAERLRVCLLLRKAGVGRGGAGGDEPGWKAWYVRALARASALEAVDLSDAAAASSALVAEVAGQASWNEATAHRMHRAGQRLERVGEWLFITVLAAATGWLILRFVDAHAAHDLKYALTAVTAGLPAIATASYGIRIILDFEGVAERSRRMAAALRCAIHDWEAAPHSVASFQAFVRLSAEIMLGDVVTWRLLAEGRRLSIPG